MLGPLAVALLQDGSKARAPDAALYDELIWKTNAMKAFVADYRVHLPGEEHEKSIRILYRAPGEMRIDIPEVVSFAVRDGVFDVSATPPGGEAMTAHVPIGDFEHERRARLAEIVGAELPAAANEWEAGLDCGVILTLDVSPSRTDDKDDFQFQAGYDCRRTALLTWLESWKSRDDVRYDGEDHLTLATSRGARLRLSTRTGFIDRIEKEVHGEAFSFDLVSLDLDPKFDANAFDVPAAPKDARDASAPFSSKLQNSVIHAHRAAIFHYLSSHVDDKSLSWDSEARGHVRKILDRLYADCFAEQNAAELTTSRKAIEDLGSAARERYKKLSPSDAVARGTLDEQYEAQRKTIVAQFEKELRSLYSDMAISKRTVPDAALRDDLQEIDHGVFEEAFDRVIKDPLLEAFDEAISKAKVGG